MRVPVQRIRKQGLDFGAAKLARRQADAMHDNEAGLGSVGSRVPVRAVAYSRLLEPACGFVYGEEA